MGKMEDEEERQRYANLPIPTYEEATSRPSSSTNDFRGPAQISDDAERQGLLGAGGAQPKANSRRIRPGGYQPATVESARSSLESRSDDESIPDMMGDEEEDDPRRVEEFDYLEPGESEDGARRQARLYHRARLRNKFSQHLTSIGATLSAIRLPSFRSLYSPVSGGEGDAAPPPADSTWHSRLRERTRVPDHMMMSASTFARLFGLFMIGGLVWILFAMNIFPAGMQRMGMHFDPESVRSYVQEHVDAKSIQGYLYHISSFDHVAGTEGDLYMARWMQERWIEEGNLDDVALLDYYVYLNYPTPDGRSVELLNPDGENWIAALEEENFYGPRSDGVDRKQTLAWHGHSKNGQVEAPLVYVNGGSREDFQWLKEQGIVTEGTIALMRYYGTQGDRALKIKAAENAGCVGALIYSDPADDGAAKGPVWPDGPWRPEDSLQRGGVSLMSWVVGDPLTPGYASTLDAKRVGIDDNPGLVGIPSLPLAWRDAKELLKALSGHGIRAPKAWIGGSPDFQNYWSTGNVSDGNPVVNLKNMNDESEHQRIWNLHGLIQGIETPEKKVIVGNHRDAWCFGAVDPGSGSAIMMELVSIFGRLRELGWRPLRTIEFASWDAEEYNLVGSTEYVEDNIDYLRTNGLAYLNVDVGVAGPDFRAAASPLWERSLLRVLDRVTDPNTNDTLRAIWDRKKSALDGLGAGSDYVAFQDLAGTSSIDFGFEGPDFGFPYHSCYETFEWMQAFGDPKGASGMDLPYHHALAQVWALLILEIADRPIIPYDLHTYASAIQTYAETLQKDAEATFAASSKKSGRDLAEAGFDLKPLLDAVESLEKNTNEFHTFEDTWSTQVLGRGGIESQIFALKRIEYNNRIGRFETDLLDIPDPGAKNPLLNGKDSKGKKREYGIPGRTQFKHVVFGPQAWSGYDEAYFPAVRDAVAAGNWSAAQEMVKIAAARIVRAGERLVE